MELLVKSVRNSKSLNGVACISPTLSQFLFLISNTNNINSSTPTPTKTNNTKASCPYRDLVNGMSWNKIFHFSNSVISSWLSILAVPFLPRFQENNPGHIYTSLSLSLSYSSTCFTTFLPKNKGFSLLPHFSSSSSSRYFSSGF